MIKEFLSKKGPHWKTEYCKERTFQHGRLHYRKFKKKIEKERGDSCRKNEEISGQKAHTNTRKPNCNISTITDVFLDQGK